MTASLTQLSAIAGEPRPHRAPAFGREVIVLGLCFAAALFVISSVIWGLVGIDPVRSALPKLVGLSADALIAIAISLVLWRLAERRLSLKAWLACLMSLAGATLSALVDRGLQLFMTRPDPAPFDPQYFVSVLTFTTAELFGWSCLYLALQYSAQIRETERRLAEARQQATAAQLRALQYQVNPHFLFNTLNSVAGLIEEGASGPASDMVLRLAAFLRRTLALDPSADLRLRDEIALQLDYLEIEKARFPDRLQLDLRLGPDTETALVPALIMQPLVENAIKHGIARTPGHTLLEIAAELSADGSLRLWVENPVPRDGDADAPDGMGIGLRNVAARLAARHPGGSAFRAEIVAPNRLRVELRLPILR